MTESERLQAIAICEQIQATVAKLAAQVAQAQAAIDEFQRKQAEHKTQVLGGG